MSMYDPTQQELADFAELWARRVGMECPFPEATVTLIVRHPRDRDRCARGTATAPTVSEAHRAAPPRLDIALPPEEES